MRDMKTDRVALGVLKSRFVAAAEAMGHALERSSHSTFVKESADFATALATPRGEFFGYHGTLACPVFLV